MAGLAGQKLGHGPGLLVPTDGATALPVADTMIPGRLFSLSCLLTASLGQVWGASSSWDESIESIVCPSTPVSPSKLGRWALQDKHHGLALGGWDPPSFVYVLYAVWSCLGAAAAAAGLGWLTYTLHSISEEL